MNRITLLVAAVVACTQVSIPLPSGDSGSPPPPPSPSSGSNSVAQTIVSLTNRERTRAGRHALAADDRLMRAAQIHADQMAAARRMDHVLPDSRYPTPTDRLKAVGYAFSATAENISWNQPDAAAAVASWMRSSGHRANLLGSTYTEMGAGYATSSDGQRYYVQVFGRPR